ncbi:MAG: ribonucleoside-diphosphate reductase subunit alpha [Planctomycetota bacterium]|nr:ribonucleoside-diphosphate reductase subunit alpha [Planctomycetota bacterium]MCX8040396.1 ribonucleoside-diphosphate reductase subunit alpha [Planctomycetota bacterium]MDW8372228.1 ribonucleoside-diphosphate reductase subunit alpha [Planctomycetota bacterium]
MPPETAPAALDLPAIVARLAPRAAGLRVDLPLLAERIRAGLPAQAGLRQLDELAVRTAAGLVTTHPDYDTLAARLQVALLHEDTPATFSAAMEALAGRRDALGRPSPAISGELLAVVRAHRATLDAAIRHERDFEFDFLGICTLLQSYLQRVDGRLVERPQYLWMRVALGIHAVGLGRPAADADLARALETYELMSTKHFTHATPTLFNAGTVRPQMSSCFLIHMHDDSIEGIYKTLADCAKISQHAGGIGLHIHNIRAAGSPISGTGGTSNGIVPMLRNFDATASYVDQGGGKRKGSFAIYLEPWHADIVEFLDLKRNTGKDELRARALFYGLWVPDLFMERVERDEPWTLMDPARCPGLSDCWGEEFVRLYTRYEREGRGVRVLRAQDLWRKICEVQVETSMPYILYKDACNRKSNQRHLGTIKSSNLCTEVVEYTSPEEIAVCNLASLALPAFVVGGGIDHERLHAVTEVVVRNLDRIIDLNHYPVPEARTSNLRHRPIGIGVQGLADVFLRLRLPWGSEGSRRINREIFETIYHAALSASCRLAAELGPHPSFPGSPASQGLLQFDLWYEERRARGEALPPSAEETYGSGRYDWAALRAAVRRHGLRNSLLVALMPTASTANILGNTEGFEPIPSNIFKRNVLSGEFVRINRYLVEDLLARGLWSAELKDRIIAAEGSIQDIPGIPDDLKELYRTVWEISQRHIIDMAADRGAFICQSQSMNIYLREPTLAKLTSMHFYGWKKGLKTGSYYIRQTAARQAQKFTVDPAIERARQRRRQAEELLVARGLAERRELAALADEEVIAWAQGACAASDPEGCMMCSA